MNRSSIATLVYSIGKKKNWPEFSATLAHITSDLDHHSTSYPMYYRYYASQAIFQGNIEAWHLWNRNLIEELEDTQTDNGSIAGSFGPVYGTSMSLLALALNYRFLPIYER